MKISAVKSVPTPRVPMSVVVSVDINCCQMGSHAEVRTHIHTHAHTHMHTHTYVRTHTDAHTHTYLCMNVPIIFSVPKKLPLIYPLDIDECRVTTHNCSHSCYNFAGSFECRCRRGYRIMEDGKSCQGALCMSVCVFACACVHGWGVGGYVFECLQATVYVYMCVWYI